MTKRCRACGGRLFPEPLLRLSGMPAAAQFLPDASRLEGEQGLDLSVRQCSACGLVQLDCPPVPYYREVIRATAVSAEMARFRSVQLADFVQRFSLAGRNVVEIGCGGGEYMALLRAAGVEPQGLEFSASAVRRCRAQGLSVAKGFVSHSRYAIRGAPFAAFFMFNFLEHFPDPVRGLLGVAHNLEDAAVGLVEVPNFDMMLRKAMFAEFIPDHLVYFTSGSFAQVLSMAGFEVLECRQIWQDYILSASVRRRPRLDLGYFLERHRQIEGDVRAYLERYGTTGVAIWGAGHQALALVNLLGLKNSIRYVVDSAPFKQGRYTPGSHLPILPPSRLREDPVAAVIVMAAGYSDEVAEILCRDYDPQLGIAILGDAGLRIVR